LQRRTRLEETKDELTNSNETLDDEILVGFVVLSQVTRACLLMLRL